jgi:hypothetical protein
MHPRRKRSRFDLTSGIEENIKKRTNGNRQMLEQRNGYICRQNGAPMGRKGFNAMTISDYVWFGVLIVLLVLNVAMVVAGRNNA